MRITSTRNPAVQQLRELQRAGGRREQELYVAEGVRLVTEALATGQRAALALYDPDLLRRSSAGAELMNRMAEWPERAFEADERVLAAAAQTEHPGGIVVSLSFPEHPPHSLLERATFGLILDRLADPGNAGTILRTADAAGVDYVVTTPDTVDLFSPKVVRAGMGAHFRLPLFPGMTWDEIGRSLDGAGGVVAEAEAGESIYDFEWPDRTALVVGSEAHGISPEAAKWARSQVSIPMRPGVESLNASVAASIVIYSALGPSLGNRT